MRNRRRLALVPILAMLGACATAGPARVPGATLASPKLQKDTVETIKVRESMSGNPCKTATIVGTEVLGVSTAPKFDGERLTGGKWNERWTVNLCDNIVTYKVEFTTNPFGGTVISISPPEKAK